MLDSAFLAWLRTTTEARWADPSLHDGASVGLGQPAWQPATRWRGGLSDSDLRIVEAMFTVTMPAAYRRFLTALHTPDPPLAATQVRAGRIVRVEERLFTDWTGATTPIIAAFERPLEGLLRGVAIGRWHPAWGDRPDDERERLRRVRRLAAAGGRLIPFAGQHYLVALPGRDDGPVIAVRGADAAVIAPDVRAAILRELGLADPDLPGALGEWDAGRASGGAPPGPGGLERIPFWSDVVDGLPWMPPTVASRP